MRIGRTIIDIESLSIEDLKVVEHEIYELRKRREEKESFRNRMAKLLEEANAAGFDFIDEFGNIICSAGIELYDNQ